VPATTCRRFWPNRRAKRLPAQLRRAHCGSRSGQVPARNNGLPSSSPGGAGGSRPRVIPHLVPRRVCHRSNHYRNPLPARNCRPGPKPEPGDPATMGQASVHQKYPQPNPLRNPTPGGRLCVDPKLTSGRKLCFPVIVLTRSEFHDPCELAPGKPRHERRVDKKRQAGRLPSMPRGKLPPRCLCSPYATTAIEKSTHP
jgi:hypothetical protein